VLGPALEIGPVRELCPGLLDRRGKSGVAHQPTRGRKAGDVADLGEQCEAEQLCDAGDGSVRDSVYA
jgi:hypothetical protein